LGTRLKERRQELGKRLAEVAAAADVSGGYLSSIENGASVPSLPVLARLSHALELSLAELLRTSASPRLARGHLGGGVGGKRLAAGERPRARILPGGVSNKTVLVERDGEAWVLKQALAKLRVPVDWFSDPIRIHREASALRWFEELAPGAAPKLVFEDRDEHVLCMEAVPEPHENWKDKLLDGRVDRDDVRQFGALLGDVHRRSAARLDALEPEFGDRSFFESLRIEPYYLYTAERVPAAAPFLLALVDETRPIAAALTHGDFSPKNVLVYQGRPKLLDYEVAHIGDPALDLGFSL